MGEHNHIVSILIPIILVVLLCICCCIGLCLTLTFCLFICKSSHRRKIFAWAMYIFQGDRDGTVSYPTFHINNVETNVHPSFSHSKHHDESVEICEGVEGVVLEIGPGNGHLLRILKDKDITRYIGIDHSLPMLNKMRNRIDKMDPPLEFSCDLICDKGLGEVDSESVDYMIFRHVLCSIANDEIPGLIRECHRVLKDGGSVLLLEHVRYRNSGLCSSLQRLCSPVCKFMFDNCDCWKDTQKILEECCSNNGIVYFEVDLVYKLMEKVRLPFGKPHIYGRLTKKSDNHF